MVLANKLILNSLCSKEDAPSRDPLAHTWPCMLPEVLGIGEAQLQRKVGIPLEAGTQQPGIVERGMAGTHQSYRACYMSRYRAGTGAQRTSECTWTYPGARDTRTSTYSGSYPAGVGTGEWRPSEHTWTSQSEGTASYPQGCHRSTYNGPRRNHRHDNETR